MKCYKCDEVKLPSEFYSSSTTQCKVCRRKANQIYSKTPAGLDTLKRSRLKHRYGMTMDDYHEMLREQNGACAICKTTDTAPWSRFSVDHDHNCCPGNRSCGKCIRGLLCLNCNNKVEWFDTNRAAVESYLGR